MVLPNNVNCFSYPNQVPAKEVEKGEEPLKFVIQFFHFFFPNSVSLLLIYQPTYSLKGGENEREELSGLSASVFSFTILVLFDVLRKVFVNFYYQ